ncbi:MAG TPA: hypothetical protein VJL60_04210 [Gammaproteobacteria bacterium]|nr:hypothetical protein [Gammaproteobacteria bacterium]
MSQLKDVYTEWQNNPIFRAEFKKNPQKALKEAGLTLNKTDFKKIHALLDRKGNQSPDEKLDDRITK